MADKDAPLENSSIQPLEVDSSLTDPGDLRNQTSPKSSSELRKEAAPVLTEKEIQQTLKIVGESVPYKYSIFNSDGAVADGRYNQIQKSIADANTIALGDLHGSYQKLMETLVVTGMASMPPESARQLVKLSQRLEDLVANNPLLMEVPVEPERGPLFERILSKIYRDEDVIPLTPLEKASQLQEDIINLIKTMSWTGKDGQSLILIGDVLADRGISDRITLELLSHISRPNPERIIRLASNHDHAGVHFLLTGKTTMHHQGSQTRAFQMTRNEDYDALGELYLEHISQLKLMHLDHETKTLYTHAPVTKENIISLINNLKAEDLLDSNFSYHDISSKNISQLIDVANYFYKEAVMFPFENNLTFVDDLAEETLNNDRSGFLWSRSSHPLIENLPLYEKGVNALVHGHDHSTIQESPYSLDSAEKDPRYSIAGLDSDVRKVPGYSGKNNCRLFIS